MFDTGFNPSAPELMIYADLAPESERLAKLIAEISAKGYNPFVQLGEYRSHTTPRLPRQDVVLPAIPSRVRKEPSPYPHGDRVALLDYVRDSGRVHFTDTTTPSPTAATASASPKTASWGPTWTTAAFSPLRMAAARTSTSP